MIGSHIPACHDSVIEVLVSNLVDLMQLCCVLQLHSIEVISCSLSTATRGLKLSSIELLLCEGIQLVAPFLGLGKSQSSLHCTPVLSDCSNTCIGPLCGAKRTAHVLNNKLNGAL